MMEFAKHIPKPKVRTFSDEEWYEQQQQQQQEQRDIVDMNEIE